MIGQTISQYRILEKIGEGGMGVVYKAQDVKLNRNVALKFMPGEAQLNEEDRQRFLQEAQSAALLNHPHVCIIHDIRDEGEHHFIVMEYVDGETLRKKIYGSDGQRLDEKSAVGYAMQAGDALAEAHRQGIVHRDIKSDNIMVNARNQVKVMDFGLAKLKGSMKLTRAASTIGTLAYMAPEQVRGEEVDARSDIFSYGVLLFEMLSGRMPFRGEHDSAMMYSIMNEDPEALTKYNPDVSPDLARVIERALEKDPEDRYQHIDDLVSELRRIQKKSSRIIRPVSGSEIPVQPLSVPPTAAGSGASSGAGDVISPEVVPQAAGSGSAVHTSVKPKRKMPLPLVVAIAAIALLVAAYFVFLAPGGSQIDSLAVLPFVNVGGDPESEYLTEGMTDFVTNQLSQMAGLRVLPASFVSKYRNSEIDPRSVGADLDVGAILIGRVTERNGKMSMQAELIDVGGMSQIWGERYERDFSEIQSLQADIVAKVSDRLGFSMGAAESANLKKGSTKNNEAYQLYLKGRHQWNKRTPDGIRKAVGYFQDAIDLDPGFALAYVGLAQSYIFPESEDSPAKVRWAKLKAAADRALQIEEGLAEAHVSLHPYYAFFRYDWKKSEQVLKRGLELDPDYPTGLHWYAELLTITARFEEGRKMYRRAVDADPLSLAIATDFGIAYYYSRDYDSAAAYLERILKTDPEYVRTNNYLFQVYLAMGEDEKAYQALRRERVLLGDTPQQMDELDRAFARAGMKGYARLFIDRAFADSTGTILPPVVVASAYLILGEKETAIEWLERSIREGDPYVTGIGIDPFMDPLRSDPRFVAMTESIGMKEVSMKQFSERIR